jgi:glycolate oxidase FAD binding subunit
MVMEPRAGTADDAVLGAVPRLCFEPRTVAEAAEAMARCARDRLAVGFVGGGTDLALGPPPAELDALVRTAGLARVVEHQPADQVVTVEAGLTLAALQAALAPHGQRLALDPPWPERATLGGIVAANAFGPCRARHGSARDLILGASLVRADGTPAKGGGKVVKNVAGFDLPRLLVGSLGTLGLVTTVTFRVHPLPEAAATVLVPGLDAAAAWALTRGARDAQLEPSAAVALASSDRLDLGVRFEGFAPGVDQQVARFLALARAAGGAAERADEAGAAAFWARHDAVRTGGPLRAKLSGPPSALAAVAREALAPILGELSPSGAAWYPTLGLGFVSGRPARGAGAAQALRQARAALAARGGSLVLADAPPELRAAVDVWGAAPGGFPLMEELKRRLDPDRRLNPGRFVGGL